MNNEYKVGGMSEGYVDCFFVMLVQIIWSRDTCGKHHVISHSN